LQVFTNIYYISLEIFKTAKVKISESDYTKIWPWISLLKSVNALIWIESGSENIWRTQWSGKIFFTHGSNHRLERDISYSLNKI